MSEPPNESPRFPADDAGIPRRVGHPVAPRGARTDRNRAARWWIAAATFVVGLIAGGLVVGFAGWGTSSSTVAVTTSTVPATPAAPTTGSFTPGASGSVVVNTACLRALNDAQQTYNSIGQLISALRKLNAAQIDNVIQQLQPLQAQLATELRACHVVAQIPSGGVTTVTAGVSSPISIPTSAPASSPESTPPQLSSAPTS